MLDGKLVKDLVNRKWDESVIHTLCEFIKIPNQSPLFDADWDTNGHMMAAVTLLTDWAKAQDVQGMHLEVVQEKGLTPLIFAIVDATDPSRCDETVLLYGHLDKQPPMTETWDPKLGGPWTPLIKDDKLYGRGGADDGYAIFSAVTAIKALQEQGAAHGRCVLIIEASEESGSRDLPHYITKLADRIGTPSLIVCLDSGCGNYEQLWTTTSLRGVLVGELRVDILREGVHSGNASGVVPSSFRIARHLLSRIEDAETGVMTVPNLFCDVPEDRHLQAQEAAQALGDSIFSSFPYFEGARPVRTDNPLELLLNKTWRPTLCVTGVDGIPHTSVAGNVLRAHTALTLSIRLPPTVDATKAGQAVKQTLEQDVPYGAKAVFEIRKISSGWNAPSFAPWLLQAVSDASTMYFDRPAATIGEGGSIPFMGMLGEKFPDAQFMITGVLGPNSNAHGPNEFMHIPQSKGVTCCVANVLVAHSRHFEKKH